MRAIRFRAFILTPLLVAPTGRYAAGVARVRCSLGRRASRYRLRDGATSNSECLYPLNFENPRILQGSSAKRGA